MQFKEIFSSQFVTRMWIRKNLRELQQVEQGDSLVFKCLKRLLG